jgi:hypothetical protein
MVRGAWCERKCIDILDFGNGLADEELVERNFQKIVKTGKSRRAAVARLIYV